MYKIGRNDLCPCGSRRKYKYCCSLDTVKNEKILRAAAQVGTYEELVTLVQEPAKVYRLLVTLSSIRSCRPAGTVSRTIEIEEDDTLYDLHWEIQNAFGWDNDHLYSFYMSKKRGDTQSEYAGNPIGEDIESSFGEPTGSAAQTELRALKLKKGAKFEYLFDYGDNLLHTIEVVDIQDRVDDKTRYPRVAEKVGTPPPQYDQAEE